MTARLKWLIDANVVSEMMRPRPEPRVEAYLDSIADDGLGLASITVWEVLRCRAPYRSLEGFGLCSISIPLGALR